MAGLLSGSNLSNKAYSTPLIPKITDEGAENANPASNLILNPIDSVRKGLIPREGGPSDASQGGTSDPVGPISANRTFNMLSTPIAKALAIVAPTPLGLFAKGVSMAADMSVKDAAAEHGISSAEVDAGRAEGAANDQDNAPGGGMTGNFAGLGALGTGGQGGIDSAGDDGPGDSKVVCTMMNNKYGFGSFRQSIWLNQSKTLHPAYQRGYHAIFKPLLKISFLHPILEHIARHRTADIWKQKRGKRAILGAVYRMALEPLCFVVGLFVKEK